MVDTLLGAPAARLAHILPLLTLHHANGIQYLRELVTLGLLHSKRARVPGEPQTLTYYFTTTAEMQAFWSPYQDYNRARAAERNRAGCRRRNARSREARRNDPLNAEARARAEAKRQARLARAERTAAKRAAREAERQREREARDAAALARATARAAQQAAAKAAKAAEVARRQALKKATQAPGKGRLPVGASRPTKRDDEAWRQPAPVPEKRQCKVDPIIPPGLVIERAAPVSDYKHQVTGPVLGGFATQGIGSYLDEPPSSWVAAVVRPAANEGQGRAAA